MQFQVMVKPSGASCNLRCSYCFYTEKENLYGGPAPLRMPPDILESFIRQYVACQDEPEIQFAWQGGEPTLLGVDYFRTVVALQEKHAGQKKITNTIQTNGTLLSDEWCRLFKKHNFLVGLSIDGPRDLHNRYRIKGNGKPSFDTVMSGMVLLRKHKVPFNTLTVVNDYNSRRPLDVYRFLKSIGDGHMQFIPAVERMSDENAESLSLRLAIPPSIGGTAGGSPVTPWSVSPKQLANFYNRIFDEWVRHDVGTVFVQFFDVALGNWLGASYGLCHFSPTCGMAGALEHNGDLYSCDHYVYPGHKLGNIMETPLAGLMASAAQRSFGNAKLDRLTGYCKDCDVRPACHGDCLKHRFTETPDGEPGLSYLCEAYQDVFSHMAPYLRVMAELIQAGRPAPDIMGILRQQSPDRPSPAPGRNAPCPCSSGKKYKRCCGA